MDIQRYADGDVEVRFDVRPDITTKFHEKFVAMQALGAYCLDNSTYEAGEVAAFLTLRIGDTKHEDEAGERHPVTVPMSEFELDTFNIALRQLYKNKFQSLVVAANSGDMVNCAYKMVEAVVANEMYGKLQAETSNLNQTPSSKPKQVGFGRQTQSI